MANAEVKIKISDLDEFKELIESLTDNFEYLPYDVKQALLKFKDKEG